MYVMEPIFKHLTLQRVSEQRYFAARRVAIGYYMNCNCRPMFIWYIV